MAIKITENSADESAEIQIDEVSIMHRFRASGIYTAWKNLVTRAFGNSPNASGDVTISASDLDAVDKTSNQPINGIKTFLDIPTFGGTQSGLGDSLVKQSYVTGNSGVFDFLIDENPYTRYMHIYLEYTDGLRFLNFNIHSQTNNKSGEVMINIDNLVESFTGAYYGHKMPFGGTASSANSTTQWIHFDSIEVWGAGNDNLRMYEIDVSDFSIYLNQPYWTARGLFHD